jgi:hypothetical protein
MRAAVRRELDAVSRTAVHAHGLLH